MIGRLLGLILATAGFAALFYDLFKWFRVGHFKSSSIASLWNELSPSGYKATELFFQKNLFHFLWDPVMLFFLHLWAWAFFVGLGVFLLVLCRKQG